jgi:integrase
MQMARRTRREGSLHRRANGEGTICPRKDGRWEAAYFAPDGQRRRLLRKTQDEARRALTAALKARDEGQVIPRGHGSVADLLENWLPGMRPRIRYSTWRRYRQLIERHILPACGRISLARLSPMDVQRMVNRILGAGLSPTTAHHAHAVLRRALRDAVAAELVGRNVAAMVKPPPMAFREMQTLDADQARAFLAAGTGDRWEALWILAVTTGMRQGELLGLRWSDVDLDRGVLHVTGNLSRGPNGLEVTRPKTHRSRRPIRLSQTAVDAMRRQKAAQAAERLQVGAAWEDHQLVFCRPTGRPVTAAWLVRGRFQPLLKRAGLPLIRFHDLRHTAATLWFRSGVNPKIVQETLGHSRVAITLDTYSHMIPDLQLETARVMDELFSPGFPLRGL